MMGSGNCWRIGLVCALLGCNGGGPSGEGGAGDEGEASKTPASELSLERIDTNQADILFVIDNSGSMREEQDALREELPELLRALSSGDTDGDGDQELPPFDKVRLGVVSTDMGLYGITGIPNCDGLGDDGLLQHASPAERFAAGEGFDIDLAECADAYPEFLSYDSDVDDIDQVATDFACVASLGTEGCGFEQQLEAALKAVAPSSELPITFLGDPTTGLGLLGHGDGANANFLRTDPDDPSLLIVVVVTDEEDCSSSDTRHFTPPNFLDPTDPLAMQDLNLRCFYNKQNLYDTARYVDALRALRPDHPERVIFGLLAGVPADLVDADARGDVDFDDHAERNAYYDDMLADERMQEVVDPTRAPGEGNLIPSCENDKDGDGNIESRAYPPRRLVTVAQDFGPNGFVQSICQNDFAPAMDAMVKRIAERMAAE